MHKLTPTTVGAVGLPLVPVTDPISPVIVHIAVIVVGDEIPVPLTDPLVVNMFPCAVDMFRDEVTVPLVVDMLPLL